MRIGRRVLHGAHLPSWRATEPVTRSSASIFLLAAFNFRCFIHKNGSCSGPETETLALKIRTLYEPAPRGVCLSFLVIAKF